MLSAAMENVRWLANWSLPDRDTDRGQTILPRIGRVGIIGAGMMGTAIAAAHVQHRFPVVIHDTDTETLEGAAGSIAAELLAAGSHLSPGSFRRLVHPTADLAEAARCDLVLESIVETVPEKLRLYARLQTHLSERAIVASNTSTIPIGQLAGKLADTSRFCGMHFCWPVHQRRLVEIVRGAQTSDLAVGAVAAHAKRIGRMPIVVEDGPGFVVNRLLFPYLGEALQLLREGASMELIERSATDFGMALGPLRLMDEIGLDTVLRAAWMLASAFPKRIISSPLLVSMVKAGRRGRKVGAGFFTYGGSTSNDARAIVDPAVIEIIAPWIDSSERHTSEQIVYRLVLPMVLEATRVLAERKVGDVCDIDRAALFGLGFPPEKGGLLWWADTLGVRRIVALLQSLTQMGSRAEPTPMIEHLAKTGGRFYGNAFSD